MAATVSPAIVKSTEALGILVDELAKQMQQTDGKIARLYSELELRQANQGELWIIDTRKSPMFWPISRKG